MFDFRRITLFCLEKRLSKHKMTVCPKNLGGHALFAPPGYAYESERFHKALDIEQKVKFGQKKLL